MIKRIILLIAILTLLVLTGCDLSCNANSGCQANCEDLCINANMTYNGYGSSYNNKYEAYKCSCTRVIIGEEK